MIREYCSGRRNASIFSVSCYTKAQKAQYQIQDINFESFWSELSTLSRLAGSVVFPQPGYNLQTCYLHVSNLRLTTRSKCGIIGSRQKNRCIAYSVSYLKEGAIFVSTTLCTNKKKIDLTEAGKKKTFNTTVVHSNKAT